MRRTFPRNNECLQDIFDFVGEFFDRQGLGPQHRFFADFVIEELFTNTVKHNPEGSGGIRLDLEISDQTLILRLTDSDCQPFDPTQAKPPDTTAPLKDRPEGGLGIHLVKKMADQIEYSYKKGVGTIVVTKDLSHV